MALALANAVCVDHSRTLNSSTVKSAAPLKPTEGTMLAFTPFRENLRLADAGITTEPRGLTDTQSRPANLFTTAAVPGRSAALDVCVASSNAAAVRGDAAQAACDRKISHYKRENSTP